MRWIAELFLVEASLMKGLNGGKLQISHRYRNWRLSLQGQSRLHQQGLSNPSFDYLPSFQMGGWSLEFLLAFCERMS